MASAEEIIEIIEKLKGSKLTALEHYQRDPFVVLISTILSQRTRDENTIKATNKLFSVYKTPEEIAKAPLEKLEEIIKEVGFYKVKAKRIKEVSRIIAEKYNNKVPDNIEELLKLPGVGRKTANCVLVYGYNKHAIPVDTHVHRISNRLGLVKTKSPEETEKELIKIIPKKYWRELNSLFVKFGQTICKPANPRCNECPLADICPSKKKA